MSLKEFAVVAEDRSVGVETSGSCLRKTPAFRGHHSPQCLVALSDVVAIIPIAALVGIMVFVACVTFDWHSVTPTSLKTMPKSETTVMVLTVILTVATHNLAIGVIGGVLMSMVLFARRVANFVTVDRTIEEHFGVQIAKDEVDGALFFASSNDLYYQFQYAEDPGHVVIDITSLTCATFHDRVARFVQGEVRHDGGDPGPEPGQRRDAGAFGR